MAKIVKIPLVMKNGEKVTDIKSLQDNFDIESIVGYFLDGKLEKWLNDRYYEDEADAVSQISREDCELAKKLCEIFGVDYSEDDELNAEKIAIRNERIAKLKQLTDNEDAVHDIDSVAFNQEELADLYDEGIEKIYLCEGEFIIPKSKQKLEYVVIDGSKVHGLLSKTESTDKYDIKEDDLSIANVLPFEIKEKFENYLESDDSLYYCSTCLFDVSSISDMFYQEDAIHTKFEAERRVCRQFTSIHSQAVNFFNISSSQCVCNKAAKVLLSLIKNDLLVINDELEQLDDSYKKRNKNVLSELNQLIAIDSIEEKITSLTENELCDNYYQLPDASSYFYRIDYTSSDCDGGLGVLFKQKDWWYDGSDAWDELDSDVTRRTEMYAKTVSSAFKREIIKPILELAKRFK